MATKKVNIDIIARDKSKQALRGVQGSLDKVRKSVFNVRNALVGLGAGLAIRSLVNTGKQIEGLQVRLKFLFGSVEEGTKAFDEMAKFAAKVPFSLEQIQAGSGNLAVVAKDAKELAHLMKITGNVAAATGLDFRTTAEQIQRSLSAGISAADLFRDRGVKAMLGFSAGAKVSIEDTAEAFDRVFGDGGKFGGTTDALAQTLEGTMSMIGDKFFQFKRDILDAGFFPELKRQFGDLNKFLEENEAEIKQYAILIGENLASALQKIVKFGKVAADNMKLFGLALLTIVTLLSPQIGVITGLATAIALLANEFNKAKLAAIGINEEFSKLQEHQLKDKIKALNGELAKNADELHELESIGDVFIMGVNSTAELIKNLQEENALIHQQIGIAKNLIKEKQNNIKVMQVEELQVTSLMEAREKALQHDMKIHKEYAHFRKILANRLAKEQVEIDKKGLDEMQSNSKDALKALSGTNRKAFELYKKFQIAEASINAIKGASRAMADYSFPISLAVAASSMAKGLALVAQIKSQSFTGRQQGGSVVAGKPYMVGEAGKEMFVPSTNGNIVSNDQLGRPVNVNFNISTVDASGFNQLLTNSRGVIVNMINSAVNETGRQAIV